MFDRVQQIAFAAEQRHATCASWRVAGNGNNARESIGSRVAIGVGVAVGDATRGSIVNLASVALYCKCSKIYRVF